MMRTGIATAAAAFAVAGMLTACDQPETDQAPPSTTPTPTFPYPSLQYHTDVAAPVVEPLLSAARFALEMEVDGYRLNHADGWEKLQSSYRSRMATDARPMSEPPLELPGFLGKTGGITLRAVDAHELGDGVVQVAVCYYRTPGEYTVYKNGRTEGPEPDMGPYSLTRSRVQWTDRPASDGSIPAEPRWLLVDDGVGEHLTREMAAPVCEPFMPDPFIQKMPDPTTPTVPPTR